MDTLFEAPKDEPKEESKETMSNTTTTTIAAAAPTPPSKPIEASLSEMSLKSGMSELRNDIHLGLHEKIKIIKSVFISFLPKPLPADPISESLLRVNWI